MNPIEQHQMMMTRRQLLAKGRGCLGAAALASLLAADRDASARSTKSAADSGLPGLPHFPPTAKRVIYLFMAGGPSHIDMFDYKPALRDVHGTPLAAHDLRSVGSRAKRLEP